MSDFTRRLCLFWVGALSGMVVVGMGFGCFSMMRVGAMAGWLWTLMWGVKVWRGFPARVTTGIFWPAALLVFAALISLAFGLHAFSDSLCYRIPQMLYWLQEGHPVWIPHVDPRANGMPHVWAFISAPFFVLLGERALALPSWISILVLWAVFLDWMRLIGVDGAKRPWIALIFIGAPVFILQSCTTDNSLFITALLFISAYFAFYAEKEKKHEGIVCSALALALAMGAKPQYAVLALPWLVWFFFSSQRLFRDFHWPSLIWVLPVGLLLSPFPSFVFNYVNVGGLSVSNMGEGFSTSGTELLRHLSRSLIVMTNQVFAFPVNPFAGKLTSLSAMICQKLSLDTLIELSQLKFRMILIPEDTSIGFLAAWTLVAGLLLGKDTGRRQERKLALWALAMLLLPLALLGPGSMGRSFVAFVALAFPCAAWGLNRLPRRVLCVLGMIAFIVGLFVLVMNPARPLWPARRLLVRLQAEDAVTPGYLSALQQYVEFSEREHAGRELVEAIPKDESTVGVIVDWGISITQMWRPYKMHRSVYFFSPDVSREELQKKGIHYLIIRSEELIQDNVFSGDFLDVLGAEIVYSKTYVALSQRGAQPWFLLHLK